MTTYAELQTKVSRLLRDEDNTTFSAQVVQDMIAAGYAEIGRIAPRRFVDNITPVDDTTQYTVLIDDFPDGDARVEIRNVEVWIEATDRLRAWRSVDAQSNHPAGLTYSQAGWSNWDGVLHLPDRIVDLLDPTQHVVRVWGYAPYILPSGDDDVVPFNPESEEALLVYTNIEGLRRLTGNRALFTQWQTRSNNTDVTMASLLNDLNMAQVEWQRRARSITVLREAPG